MRLNAREAGAGPPVCLLHGLFGRAQNFGGLARILAVSHRVISLDLRNHGGSPHAAGMSYAEMAGDVLETLGELGALPCVLLGHSMGGKVAMMAALSAQAAVSGLIVGDIAPVAYRHHNARVAAAMLALELRPGLDRREVDAALVEAVPDAAVRGFLLQNLVFGAAPAWKIGLAEIAAGLGDIEGWPVMLARYEAPALFIRGGLSDYVSDSVWQAVELLFPRARLATLEGAGHWLHADRAVAFAAAASDYLAELSGPKFPLEAGRDSVVRA